MLCRRCHLSSLQFDQPAGGTTALRPRLQTHTPSLPSVPSPHKQAIFGPPVTSTRTSSSRRESAGQHRGCARKGPRPLTVAAVRRRQVAAARGAAGMLAERLLIPWSIPEPASGTSPAAPRWPPSPRPGTAAPALTQPPTPHAHQRKTHFRVRAAAAQ